MRILLLAPHPFYQERGTPIAVDMLLRVLSSEGHVVDVCTFPEGEAREYDGVTIHRVRSRGGSTRIGPGFSLRKLYTDLFLASLAGRLCRRNRYDVVHAVEEAGFVALYLKKRYRVPYVYDMDSILSDQLIESRPWLAPFRRLFRLLENRVVCGACVLAPMCQAIAEQFRGKGYPGAVVLKDVSLISGEAETSGVEDIRRELDISGPVAMYIGNLEPYQGIDLLFDAFRRALKHVDANLVIIGGRPDHIARYRERAQALEMPDRVHLLGPRPVASIEGYLRQADLLVSPRTKGNNTPMKIYSYLHSGIPVLATDLPTHTQVMDRHIAELAAPDVDAFGSALADLLRDRARRERLGRRAAEYASREHSFEGFRDSVRRLYDAVTEACGVPLS